MMQAIAELLGLLLDLLIPARRFYWQAVFNTLLAATGVVLVGLFFNWVGIEWINLIFLIFLLLSILAIATRPEVILITLAEGAASGAYQRPQTIPEELRRFFEGYIGVVGDIILWLSVIFFFLGTISIQENPGAVLVIIPALIIIGLIFESTGLARRIIYWYAIVMLIIAVASLIPGAVWKKSFGYDPKGKWGVSEKEKTLAHIEEAQLKKARDEGLSELQEILEKVENSKKLSFREKEILKKAQEERDGNTLPGKVGGGVSKIKDQLSQTHSSSPPTSSKEEVEKSSWQICFGGDCKSAEVRFFDQRETLVIDAGGAIFTGIPKGMISEGEYTGAWTMLPKVNRQPFGITFDPEWKNINGWGMDDGGNKTAIIGTHK